MTPELDKHFLDWAGRPAELRAEAGGRVNLIGEHTDYHEGLVMPAAIDLRTVALAAPRNDGLLRIRSLRTGGEAEAAVAELAAPGQGWQAYVLGPIWALRQEGYGVSGADILLDSDVPFGGGLSSSASVQVALAGVGLGLAEGREAAPPDPMLVARLARKAENEFCGVPCGIMDQVASACGRRGHAIALDCRSLERTEVPIPRAWALVVADSGVKHALGTSEYGLRQRQCAEGLEVLRREGASLRSLRDLTLERLVASRDNLSEVVFRRLRHVVTENDRVLGARRAMEAADASEMGRLLRASHESLARDYEVSCAELDELVELASKVPGVIGARLTGAGFGGNTVNLVQASRAQQCRDEIARAYRARTGRSTRVLLVRASDGLSVARLT